MFEDIFIGDEDNKFLRIKELSRTQISRAKCKSIEPKPSIINANEFFKSWGQTLFNCGCQDEVKYVVDCIMNDDRNGIRWDRVLIKRDVKKFDLHEGVDSIQYQLFIHGNHWVSVRKSGAINSQVRSWGLFAGKTFKLGLYSCEKIYYYCAVF